MKRILYLLVAALLVGSPSLATDGDVVAGMATNRGDFSSQSFYLCDSADSTDSSCASFSVSPAVTAAGGVGFPSYWKAEIAEDTGCSGAMTVTVLGAALAAADTHTEITLTVGGTTSALRLGPPPHILSATLATVTSCTDIDVIVTLFYEKD